MLEHSCKRVEETHPVVLYFKCFVIYNVEVGNATVEFDLVTSLEPLLVLSVSISFSSSIVVDRSTVSIVSVMITSIVSIMSVPGPVTVVVS